jgi:hypothetical protein
MAQPAILGVSFTGSVNQIALTEMVPRLSAAPTAAMERIGSFRERSMG